MGEIVIHRGTQKIDLFSLSPFVTVTKAEHVQELLSLDRINISISSSQPLTFFLSDYIIHEGRKFTLNLNPRLQKQSENIYLYDLQFEGVQYDLLRKKYFNYDSQGHYTTGDFPLTGEISVFLVALLNNAKRDELEYNWVLGDHPVDSDTKTITFDNLNCLAALQTICSKDNFNVEFEIVQDIVNKINTLHIRNVGVNRAYEFEYGYRNGLYSLIRENVSEGQVITRLYPFGSSENIPTDYRNFSPRLKLPESYGDYIQDNAKVALFGLVEEIKNYDDVKPTFKGIVSSLGTLDTAKGTYSFVCSNMDFDLNEKKDDHVSTKYLISGTPAKIHINKGNLAGYEFEIHKYVHATKTFEIKQFADERGQKFPDLSTVFKLSVNDEFTLLDIIMPQSYITNAEIKLKEKALEDYGKLSQNNVKYLLDIDPDFFAKIGGGLDVKHLGIGDYINIKDVPLGINKTSRIISLNRDLLSFGGYKYSADISDTYEINIVTQILQDLQDVSTQIQTVTIKNREAMLSGYRRMRELQGLIFDTDGYFDPVNIKPNSIETNMLSIGARSQQLTLENVIFTANKNNEPNSISISEGKLIHFSIDESGVKEWNLLSINKNLTSNSPYYIYARVPRNASTGTFFITTEQIKFDSENDYYNFLVAVLFSPQNGLRMIQLMYGSTFINGRTITTGKIQSIDGKTSFDLDSGQIKGNIEFTEDSPAIAQVTSGGENLLYPKDEYFDFIPNIDRYFNKNLQYVFSIDIDNNTYKLPEATMILFGKKNSDYIPLAEKQLSFQSSNNTGISRAYVTFSARINDYKALFCKVVGSSNADFPISNPKLETGSLASDYSNSQYYLEKRIEEIESGANWFKTTISGNIITTGTLLLGNYETGTNAGITGVGNSEGVFFWAGSTYAGRNTAPIRFYRNGTGYLQNVTIEGVLKAGRIGGENGWTVTEDEITSEQGNVVFKSAEKTLGIPDVFVGLGSSVKNYFGLPNYSVNFIAQNNKKYITPAGKINYGAIISAANAQTNVGLDVSASGGTTNNAIQIGDGDVVVDGIKAGSGSFQVGNIRITYRKGLIIKNEIV